MSFRTSRRTSEGPSLPAWIAVALPSDVTIQYIDDADTVGGQRD